MMFFVVFVKSLYVNAMAVPQLFHDRILPKIYNSSFINHTILRRWETGYISRYSDVLPSGRLGFDSRQGARETFFTASRPVLGSTQPRIEWVPRAFSPGMKRLGGLSHHSPPSSAVVENGRDIPPLPHTSSWRSA
jgi:hypothetical protein